MGRFKQIETNLPERYFGVIKNAESTASIPLGTPVVLNLQQAAQPTTGANGRPAGFEDGLQVVLPATAGAFAARFFHYGVAMQALTTNQYGPSQVHGVCAAAIIKYATRAASTNSWTSSASIAGSQLLTIDTIDNAFTTVASSGTEGTSATTVSTYASAGFHGVLLDSIASFAASASATSDSRTVLTSLARVFLRQM